LTWILRVKDRFQAAHYLENYKGKCEKIHGHSFTVEVRIKVGKLDKTGIGFDFTEIKKKLSEILPDHSLLNETYDFNPTAENLARHFYWELKKIYPINAVTVWESEDASATYTEDI